jgi:hypothetical protein
LGFGSTHADVIADLEKIDVCRAMGAQDYEEGVTRSSVDRS